MVEDGGGRRGLNRYFNLREAELSHWTRRSQVRRDDRAETFNLTRTERLTAALLKQITAGWSWTNAQYVRITHNSQRHPPVRQSPWKQRSSCQRGSVGAASLTTNFKHLLLRKTSRWHLPVFSSSPPHEPSSGIFSDSCEYFSPNLKETPLCAPVWEPIRWTAIRRSKPNHLILAWIYYFLTFRQMKSSWILRQQLLF